MTKKNADFYRGVRASIAWLHEHARTMNDPHARAVLNSAALGLGVAKPDPDEPAKTLEPLDTCGRVDVGELHNAVSERYPKILKRLAE